MAQFNIKQLKGKTNDERVLAYLQHRKSGLTSLDSFDTIGVHRISASVNRLRKAGHPIVTEKVEVENRFGDKIKNIARYKYVA